MGTVVLAESNTSASGYGTSNQFAATNPMEQPQPPSPMAEPVAPAGPQMTQRIIESVDDHIVNRMAHSQVTAMVQEAYDINNEQWNFFSQESRDAYCRRFLYAHLANPNRYDYY